jgi:hypothetical protein
MSPLSLRGRSRLLPLLLAEEGSRGLLRLDLRRELSDRDFEGAFSSFCSFFSLSFLSE